MTTGNVRSDKNRRDEVHPPSFRKFRKTDSHPKGLPCSTTTGSVVPLESLRSRLIKPSLRVTSWDEFLGSTLDDLEFLLLRTSKKKRATLVFIKWRGEEKVSVSVPWCIDVRRTYRCAKSTLLLLRGPWVPVEVTHRLLTWQSPLIVWLYFNTHYLD